MPKFDVEYVLTHAEDTCKHIMFLEKEKEVLKNFLNALEEQNGLLIDELAKPWYKRLFS